jgi:antitoxin (DNA-binding transcriptional repressor) of toxin-antitoxin stability system
MSELPLDNASSDVTAAAHDASRGQVVYLTEHGQRVAAIVPASLAAELERLTPAELAELLEDFTDAAAAREALAEPGDDIPAEQVWAELGLS